MVWFGIGNGLGRDSVLGEKFGLARQRLDSCCRRFQQPPMSLSERTRPGLGIIEPCLPSPAKAPPSGPGWLHEIKHDGFRIMAWRDSASVRLIARHGNDFTSRFPVIVAAVTALPARSFLIDGKAIVTNGDGLAVFDLIRHKRPGDAAVPVAFDLIELDGDDLRRSSIEYRKCKLARLLRRPDLGIVLISITSEMARSFSSTPASQGARASCRSGSGRCIAPAVRGIRSKSKTRKRQRSRTRLRKIGALSQKQSAALNELTPSRYLAPATKSDNSPSRSRHRHDTSNGNAGDDSTRLAQSHSRPRSLKPRAQ